MKGFFYVIQYCFCFIFFGHEGRRFLAPPPGIEPVPPALEGEILTIGHQGSSGDYFLKLSPLWH